jgi:hypothetical protein
MFNIWYLSPPAPPPLPLLMTGPLDMHVAQWCMKTYNYYSTFKHPITVVVRAELTAVHKTIEYINTNLK